MRSTFRLLLIFLVLMNLSNVSFAGSGNDNKRDERKEGATPKKKASKQSTVKTIEQLRNLDIQNERGRASSSVNEVDAMQRYVDYLSPSDLNRLPIGLKKKIGNSTVKIAISNAVFTPKYAELTVYAKVDIPQNNNSTTGTTGSKTIFFGIKGLKLSKDGGIIGDAKLVLLGDYKIPINGGNSSLTLKGDFNINTGATSDSATYLRIDCNGFKELGLNADVEFPRSMLIPVDNNGSEIGGLVTGRIRNFIVSNWNDIIASFSLPKFQVKGVKGVCFDIQSATIDLSDYRNSSEIIFPIGYKEKYLDKEPELMNLWRGVYAKEIRVTLPKSFKDKTTATPVSFGTQNLIIDNNGITGLFFAQNILPLEKGSAGGWRFSVDSFRIAIEANRLLRAGFGGKIGLPVNKDDSTYITSQSLQDSTKRDSILKRKFLAYSAVMSTSGEYLCRVVTRDSISFDIWKANIILKPNSYIELAGNSERFLPSAMLHGSMNIESKTGTTGAERLTKIVDFRGVDFVGLHLKTTAPYFSAQYFGYKGSISIGNLPISIDSITLRSIASDEIGLAFNLKVNLHDLNFAGETRLMIVGKHNDENGLAKWKYDRVKIERIYINAKIGNLQLDGGIDFLDNDPVYGDGFNGEINLGIKVKAGNTLTVGVKAIFGNIGYRYWYVDALAKYTGDGIPVAPSFNINGFAGGAYYRMRKDGLDQSNYSFTGLKYLPDSSAGLGLRAAVEFNIGKDKIDHGSASFEIAFNKYGGLRYLGFFGQLEIMTDLDLPGDSLAARANRAFKKLAGNDNSKTAAQKENDILKKILQPNDGAQDLINANVFAGIDNIGIKASVGINFNFIKEEFHANFDVYVNSPGNVITGIGQGGRAGWAVMHIDANKWYVHMGTPVDPIGLKIGLGPVSVQTTAYFMLGHDLPAFPELPIEVTRLLKPNDPIVKNINASEKADIALGKGIAFGAGLRVATGDIKFLMLYANFQAGMGFDVMVKDYSNYTCSGQKPGINGWYAEGQLYAYLQGECGVRIKIGPVRKNIAIIKGAAVAVLRARLPNPTWVGGLFKVKTELLGGAIKINVDLKFSFGQQCDLQLTGDHEGDIDFDEYKVIQTITPARQSQNVSLYARPQVVCTTKPDRPFVLPGDTDGAPDETYRPHISSILFSKGSETFGCKYKLSSDSSTLTLIPDAVFKSQTDYGLTVKVIFQKLVSGNWVDVTKDDGTTFEEVETTNFRTGNDPDSIEDNNIGYMYPFKNQRFFYRKEVTQGRVILLGTMDPLFSSFTRWKARFIDVTTKNIIDTTDASCASGSRVVTYNISSKLQVSTAYALEIYGEGYQNGTTLADTSKPILRFNFRTSQYDKLNDKIVALQQITPTPVVGRVESDVIDLQAKVSEYEGFEIAELMPSEFTGEKPLLKTAAILEGNYYYDTKIKPLIKYPNFFAYDGITIQRANAGYEVIPVDAVEATSYYLTALLSSNYSAILYDRLPFTYNLNKIFNADYIDLRSQIVNKYMTTLTTNAPLSTPMYEWYRPCWLCAKKQRLTQAWVNYYNSAEYKAAAAKTNLATIPYDMRAIVTQPFPFMTKGDYRANIEIRKAIGWDSQENLIYEQSTPAVFTFHNPIESIFYNELQTQVFTKNDCNGINGEEGESVSYTIQPGMYSSTVSQEQANQLAIDAINSYGQYYANQIGKCCINGNCYVPGTVMVSLVGYSNCYGDSFTVTFEGAYGSYTYDFPSYYSGSYQDIYIPAGTYNLTFGGYSSSWNTPTFTLQNTWQSWYGTYSSSGPVIFSSDTYYTISVSTSCNNY
jgi:hypothetical protein